MGTGVFCQFIFSFFFFFPFLSSGKILSYGVITMLVSLSSHQTSCLPI